MKEGEEKYGREEKVTIKYNIWGLIGLSTHPRMVLKQCLDKDFKKRSKTESVQILDNKKTEGVTLNVALYIWKQRERAEVPYLFERKD